MDIRDGYQGWISGMDIRDEYQGRISRVDKGWISRMDIRDGYQEWISGTGEDRKEKMRYCLVSGYDKYSELPEGTKVCECRVQSIY